MDSLLQDIDELIKFCDNCEKVAGMPAQTQTETSNKLISTTKNKECDNRNGFESSFQATPLDELKAVWKDTTIETKTDINIDNTNNNNSVTNNVFIDFDFKAVQSFVVSKIKEFEKIQNVRVLCAMERSSHVWGTSHKLSDFDIRALYYHTPREYYSPWFRLHKQHKVVYGPRSSKNEKEDGNGNGAGDNGDADGHDEKILDVELSFMELRHSCHMMMNNDPNLIEMFKSPIVYYQQDVPIEYINNHILKNNDNCNININTSIMSEFHSILCGFYDYHRLMIHYFSWAKGHYTQLVVLQKKRIQKKPLKVLFHIWRGLLSVDWLYEHKTLKGMPLYIPDLIKESTVIDDKMKSLMLNIIKNEIRQSQFDVSDKSEVLKTEADRVITLLKSRLPDKKTAAKIVKLSKDRKHNVEIMTQFEQLVFSIIEQGGNDNK